MKPISFYRHNLSSKDLRLDYFHNDKNFLTYGKVCRQVEKKFLLNYPKKFGFLSNSWTNALISLVKSLNLGKNDEVIIPCNTFVACANVFEWVGCKLVFADIDNDTMLMSLDDCLKKITKNTKIILPVHMYGNIFDTKSLRKKINSKKITIIEDSAHAVLGKYSDGKNLGYYSDFIVFSFYATKNITCGEGGALLGNNKQVIEKAKIISNNGMSKSAFSRYSSKGYKDWDVSFVGFKGLLNDLSAKLLMNQLKNISKNYKKRKKIYHLYHKHLQKIKYIKIPKISNCKLRDYYLFPIGVDIKKFKRKNFFNYLNKNQINHTVNYRSILNLNYYKKKYNKQSCKLSEIWGNRTISLPFHNKITEKNIILIAKVLKNYFN